MFRLNRNEEDDLKRLKENDQELKKYELEINGYMIRSKADYVVGGKEYKIFCKFREKKIGC